MRSLALENGRFALPLSSARRLPRIGWVGAGLLLLMVAAALFAPLLTPYEPEALVAIPFQPPSAAHPLGTDDLGHDIFSQLLYGARLSLLIGLLSATFATLVALAMALVAAYASGVVEMVLMRLVDITLSFPFLPLVIVLAAFLGRELVVTVLAITAVLWARPALVLRAQAAKIRTFQHVTAAQAMGATPLYVIGRHMLPRLLPLATAQFVRTANVAIFLEAALAFLGLGDPNRISWGTMLYFANASSAMLTDAWRWWVVPVGLALTVTIVGLAYLGFAVEAWADPRLETQGRKGEAIVNVQPISEQKEVETAVPLLRIRNLSVWYGATGAGDPVVDSVSLDVAAGQVVGLIGESGCGKSTLATAILQLGQAPTRVVRGEVWWNGLELTTAPVTEVARLRGRKIGLIPQNAMGALNPVYTVLDQVTEVTRLLHWGNTAKQKARDMLSLVGIPSDRHRAFPHELSGGMRQRVVIAMAAANEPRLLIADEPTTGLDVVTQAEILRLLLDLRQRFGVAMLLISHDLLLVGRVANRLLVMQEGQIVERGEAARIIAAPQHAHTRRLLRAVPSIHGAPVAEGVAS